MNFRSVYPTLAFASTAWVSPPQEVCSMAQVNQELRDHDLLILDIDNTLMIPKQQLGSDQWFYHQIDVHERKGLTRKAALMQALKDWEAVQAITQVLPCEPCTAHWVRAWQQKPLTVIGLTTRGLGMSSITIGQLETLEIDLSVTAPEKKELFFLNPWGVLFRKGILFTAGTHKGNALAQLLDQLELRPQRVVFVNDKASHIAELQSTVEQRGIPFLGLRYGAVDGWVRAFDPEVSQIQWDAFGHILSDDEAKNRLNHCLQAG
jgi:hypothetical protein